MFVNQRFIGHKQRCTAQKPSTYFGREETRATRNGKGKSLNAEPMTSRFTALHPALRGSHGENKS